MGTQRFEFAARYASVPEAVEAITAVLPEEHKTDLVRAGLAEALGNAVLHGAFGLDTRARDAGDVEGWFEAIEAADRSPRAEQRVCVAVRVARAAHAPCCVVRVRDPGPGFDWRCAAAREGHGLTVLSAAFRTVRWNEAGNAISLTLCGA